MSEVRAFVGKTYKTTRNHPIFARWPISKQFVKFALVGFSNVAVDFSIYFLLTRETDLFSKHLLSANILGFVAATGNSFYWNKFWTFRDHNKNYHTQYTKFLIVSTGGLLIAQLIFVTGVHYFKLFDFLVKCLAVVIVTFWNFALNKWWTFKKTI